ncbi:MAG: prepilin-type N-terminal cleavage/methylation domain-containing protein [Phycisphaerales bacterium]|nr:prepilin-type N-terminal cleavage/methylation domain-containing protein [Phycisphaerales bacterium]
MNSSKKGFTLVEILIVVIILGILAAIVVPQFTEASSDAKLSNLTTNLQAIRAQLELYRLHHNGVYPADVAVGLTTKTDSDGNAGGIYGPYMQQFPANPFVDDAAAAVLCDGAVGSGWSYTAATGSFSAATAAHTDY